MNKFIYRALPLVAMVFATTSCSDFLEQSIVGQESLDTYFYTEDECTKAVTGCYQAVMYDDWWQVSKFMIVAEMATDDAWCGNTNQDQGEYYDLAHYTGSTITDVATEFWQYRYKGILRTNVVIDRVPTAEYVDADLRARLVAEAKFLRAFFYFDLVKNFGGMPLVYDLLMPTDVVGITRATEAETYALIEQDLIDAAEVLPLKSEYSSSDTGRATKGAAQAYLAKVYLYQEKYSEAKGVLESLISSGEYKLMDFFGDVWSTSYHNNDESIFEDQNSSVTEYALGSLLPVVTGSRDDSGWAWCQPTSDLENLYLAEGDDVRLAYTIIKDGTTTIPGDDAITTAYSISSSSHKSGRIIHKYYIPTDVRPSPYSTGNHNPLNFRLMRYAEVLLMYAEVCNELGDDATAKTYLNMIRTRAGLSSVSSISTELRDAIRKERRMELAFEYNRLYDIRRWNDDSGSPLIASIMGSNGSFVNYNLNESTDEYEVSNQIENSNKGVNFRADRDLLFPIPNSEITLSDGSITQNPNF
ncbi:MAG: RagB/SusD family nutrient uptake outer membrane protein [Rikenellaceae bacterium]